MICECWPPSAPVCVKAVVAGEAEPGAGPARKRYVITEAGATEAETWLAEPAEPEPHLQAVLFAKGGAGADAGPPGPSVIWTPSGRRTWPGCGS